MPNMITTAGGSGIIITEDNTDEVAAALEQAYDRALEKIGLTAEKYARNLCPVDTGRLRNSITHTVDSGGKAAYIGTNVEYAPYVEMGTSRMKAQPFLRPAAHDHGAEYGKILEAELKK